MTNLSSVIGDYQVFLERIIREISEAGFDLDDFVQMDHLCYRVESLERYERKKQELAGLGTLAGETMVNNRPIAVFRLHEPIRFDRWRIDAVELPAPRANSPMPEGLEHVELVLFDEQQAFLAKYASKQFDMKAADRGINPEIGYKLPSFGVKFHLLSLLSVVFIERKLGMREVHDGQ